MLLIVLLHLWYAQHVSGTAMPIISSYNLQPGHLSSLPAINFQPTTTQVPDDQCGNQHYSRELLMMDIAVPETCCAYQKCNKTISSI